MVRSMAGLTVRVTINTLFYEGSGRRVLATPFTIPMPTITITPTAIHRDGICAKCAPIAKPTIIIANPAIYKPKDICCPRPATQHVAGRCGTGLPACRSRVSDGSLRLAKRRFPPQETFPPGSVLRSCERASVPRQHTARKRASQTACGKSTRKVFSRQVLSARHAYRHWPGNVTWPPTAPPIAADRHPTFPNACEYRSAPKAACGTVQNIP